MKKLLIALLKYGTSLSILAYLFYQASKNDSFSTLRDQPKHWGLLVAAFVVLFLSVANNVVRWFLLVRALELPFRLQDAFRLSFICYLFNFFTVGIVGGDIVKAIFIARQQPGRRTEAVSSVVVDRAIGLYALFFIVSLAALALNLEGTAIRQAVRDPAKLVAIQNMCHVAMGLTIAGGVGFGILLIPGFTTWPMWDLLVKLPRVGNAFERIIAAVRMYRRRPGTLLLTGVMSLGTHTLSAVGIFLIAWGLPGAHPSLGAHFVVVPLSMMANALPLPGGLGAFEYALDFLYQSVASQEVPLNQGFVVALAFRLITILIAMVGLGYYLTSRRQMADLMREAEREAEVV